MQQAMQRPTGEALYSLWRQVKEDKKLRARDAARALGVSEGELVASAVGRQDATRAVRLEGDFRELLKRMPEAGRVMALTRNEACVHERTGRYEEVSWNGHVGLVLGPDIDLRLFASHWRHGYWLEEDSPRGPLRSLQVFDASGEAVHKIYSRPETDLAALERIVADFRAADQHAPLVPEARAAKPVPRPDSGIDVTGFRQAWSAMQDTHEFFGVLKKFGVTRHQAMRLAGEEFSYAAPPDAARRMLAAAAERHLAIMVFVGNPGCIQIHTGEVRNIRNMEAWANVMDPDFNLHLREDVVASAWVVKKPTADGTVTSIELYDAAGELIVQFFGKRKPGQPELQAWRDLVEGLFPSPVPARAGAVVSAP